MTKGSSTSTAASIREKCKAVCPKGKTEIPKITPVVGGGACGAAAAKGRETENVGGKKALALKRRVCSFPIKGTRMPIGFNY